MMYRPLLEVLEVSWLGVCVCIIFIYICVYSKEADPFNSGQHRKIIISKWC